MARRIVRSEDIICKDVVVNIDNTNWFRTERLQLRLFILGPYGPIVNIAAEVVTSVSARSTWHETPSSGTCCISIYQSASILLQF